MMYTLIVGCSKDNYPKDWQPVVVTPDGLCPDIAGTYKIEHDSLFTPTGYSGSTVTSGTYQIIYPVAYQALAGQYFHEDEGVRSTWDIMTISGNLQKSLQVKLYGIGNDTKIEKVIELKKAASDYQCNQGWLKSNWPNGTPMRNSADTDWRGLVKTLNFAKNLGGELVTRTDVARWQEFSVWCGDGCKYVRIPFTREITYEWSRLDSAQISKLEPISPSPPVARHPDIDAPADESPAGRVTSILRTMTTDAVRIVSLYADGERWITRFHGSTDNLIALDEKLMTSEAFSDVTAKTAEPRGAAEKDMEFSFIIANKK